MIRRTKLTDIIKIKENYAIEARKEHVKRIPSHSTGKNLLPIINERNRRTHNHSRQFIVL